MTKYNPKNERLKREYLRYLAEAKGKGAATLDGVRKSLCRYEEYHRLKDFLPLHREQAIAFKTHLADTKGQRSGASLSKATVLTTLNHVKAFFEWLSHRQGMKRKIYLPDLAYFSLSDKETRIAKSSKYKQMPTLEQIRHVLSVMPKEGEVALRNRAVVALITLIGIRVNALISLKLRHVNLEQRLVAQDPNEVNTKFAKRIDSYFYPVGDDIEQIFVEWVKYLREVKLYGEDAPLFPHTCVVQGADYSFTAGGLEAAHWNTTTPVREIFREAFKSAGLPYYNPHSFRDTLTHMGQKRCKTPEEFKAWSQNLGHENVLTTFTSYGTISTYRQGEVIRGLGQ